MVRSRGFGSIPCDLRAVNTRFPYGSVCYDLTLPQNITRRLILQQERHHTLFNSALTACKRTVS